MIRKEPCGKCEPCEKAKKPKVEKCETPWEEIRSLLDLAHRASDAVVQSTPTLLPPIEEAFRELKRSGNAMPLCAIAPTSLIFGCWDSRGGSGEKRPRLVRSIIRAWDVEKLKTHSQFNSIWKALDENQKGELRKALPKGKKLSEKGFNDAPAEGLGGVLVHGSIERHVTINLVALRAVRGADKVETDAIRKYLLALSLLAATTDIELFLREGCNLRFADAADRWTVVPRRGEKMLLKLSTEAARKKIVAYLKKAYTPVETIWKSMQIELKHEFNLSAAKALLGQTNEDDVQDK